MKTISTFLLAFVCFNGFSQERPMPKNVSFYNQTADSSIYNDDENRITFVFLRNKCDSLNAKLVIYNNSNHSIGIAMIESKYDYSENIGTISFGYLGLADHVVPPQFQVPFIEQGKSYSVDFSYPRRNEYRIKLLLCTNLVELVGSLKKDSTPYTIIKKGKDKILNTNSLGRDASSVRVKIDHLSNDSVEHKFFRIYYESI